MGSRTQTSILTSAGDVFDILAQITETGYDGIPDAFEVPVPHLKAPATIMDLSHISTPTAREEILSAVREVIAAGRQTGKRQSGAAMAKVVCTYKKWLQ